jgi:Uma2 family endonuclease
MTADEFMEWTALTENDDKRFELEDGKVVELPPPIDWHGLLCGWLAHLLWSYAEQAGKGSVFTNDTGLLVRKRPDTVRAPDVIFSRETYTRMRKSYINVVPDLVVEVLSPSDRPGRTRRRMEQYVKRGIPLVWQVEPDDRLITVYRGDELTKTLDESDTLTGNGVLPGFKCPVADIFKKI